MIFRGSQRIARLRLVQPQAPCGNSRGTHPAPRSGTVIGGVHRMGDETGAHAHLVTSHQRLQDLPPGEPVSFGERQQNRQQKSSGMAFRQVVAIVAVERFANGGVGQDSKRQRDLNRSVAE